jgi:ribonuclease BN (tRNA processing enzyme)
VTNLRLVGFLIALGVVVAAWFLTCAAAQYDDVRAGVAPLERRSFERLTLVTLGTGSAYEDHNRRGPATALALGEGVVVVDAGRGVAQSLRHAGFPVDQPDTLLLTSLLPENTAGLADWLATAWLRGRREPVTLIGPVGTKALARAVEASVLPGLRARASGLGVELGTPGYTAREIEGGQTLTFHGIAVAAGALDGGPLPALAYRFEANGRSVVVAGTGFADDALAKFARRAQVLVHEAAYIPTPEQVAEFEIQEDPERLKREAALHTTLEAVGRVARRAEVETLVLVRLRPPPVYDLQVTTLVDDSYDGRVVVAADGDEITP